MPFVRATGHALEYELISPHKTHGPTLVFLHEGLGSIAMWRDFPRGVAAATGCAALVYSRYGHGRSDLRTTLRRPDYLHIEALEALPEVLAALGIEAPVLIGHSDGGSIALIYAAAGRWPVKGIVVMAPHEFVEEVTLAGIRAARLVYETTDLRARLAKYHRDVDSVFHAWNDTWLAPEFRDWNITALLSRIECPILAIQGEDDAYATMAQIDVIAERAREVELFKLADCGHAPHADQPEAVLAAIVRFVGRIG